MLSGIFFLQVNIMTSLLEEIRGISEELAGKLESKLYIIKTAKMAVHQLIN